MLLPCSISVSPAHLKRLLKGSFSKRAENNARVLVHKSEFYSKRQTLSVSPNPSLALQYKVAVSLGDTGLT